MMCETWRRTGVLVLVGLAALPLGALVEIEAWAYR